MKREIWRQNQILLSLDKSLVIILWVWLMIWNIENTRARNLISEWIKAFLVVTLFQKVMWMRFLLIFLSLLCDVRHSLCHGLLYTILLEIIILVHTHLVHFRKCVTTCIFLIKRPNLNLLREYINNYLRKVKDKSSFHLTSVFLSNAWTMIWFGNNDVTMYDFFSDLKNCRLCYISEYE